MVDERRSGLSGSELWQLGIDGLRGGFQRHQFSPAEVVDDLLARVDRLDREIGASRRVLPDLAHLGRRIGGRPGSGRSP